MAIGGQLMSPPSEHTFSTAPNLCMHFHDCVLKANEYHSVGCTSNTVWTTYLHVPTSVATERM